MNENSEPIGFLDSGIGGITVLNKALKLMPGENYIFYSDSQIILTAIKAMPK